MMSDKTIKGLDSERINENVEKKKMYAKRFISFINDYGFKLLFAQESSKPYLIHFLNSLLGERTGQITDLTLLNSERLGAVSDDRKIIYDVYCEDPENRRFIVEMQLASQANFIDRTVFYASRAITDQGKKGKYQPYELKRVYFIALMDFTLPIFQSDKVVHWCQLYEENTHQVLFDKLHMIYIELPKFQLDLEDINTDIEHWFYLFSHSNQIDKIPETYQKRRPFNDIFNLADYYSMSKIQQYNYDRTIDDQYIYLETLKDRMKEGLEKGLEEGIKKGLEKGREEGLEKGREEGLEKGLEKGREEGLEKGREEGKLREQRQIAMKMKSQGIDIQIICQCTGLSREEIESY